MGAESLPTVSGPHRCSTDCPANPFAFADFSASLTDGIERAALATFAVGLAGVAAVVLAEWRRASPAWRRALRPATVTLLCVLSAFVAAAALSATLGEEDRAREGGVLGAVADRRGLPPGAPARAVA